MILTVSSPASCWERDRMSATWSLPTLWGLALDPLVFRRAVRVAEIFVFIAHLRFDTRLSGLATAESLRVSVGDQGGGRVDAP